MTPEEMHDKVCGPLMQGIGDDVKDLVKTIKISNGKPCVLSRLESLEKEDVQPQKTVRKFSIGKFKAEGYDSRDIVRVAVTLGILYLILERHGLVSGLFKVIFQ